MAHLENDSLPSSFDVVVVGTGVTESVLAAAFSRDGKSVLHLDKNAYYGKSWASLMQREMLDWLEECGSEQASASPAMSMEDMKNRIVLDAPQCNISNLKSYDLPLLDSPLNLPCAPIPDSAADPTPNSDSAADPTPNSDSAADPNSDSAADPTPNSDSAADATPNSDSAADPTPNSDSAADSTPNSDSAADPTPNSGSAADPTSNSDSVDDPTPISDSATDLTPNSDSAADPTSNSDSTDDPTPTSDSATDPTSNPGYAADPTPDPASDPDSAANPAGLSPDHGPPSKSSQNYLSSLRLKVRRLVYDLLPKLLACRGKMVNLLTDSNCSRYLEFKAVSKICIYQSGEVEQVPCSRSDVFESKLVSMIEKRKMMKFLSLCSEYDEESEKDAVTGVSFGDFMSANGLNEKLAHYVARCIAMTTEESPAVEGLRAAKLFLQSLGRFDNAPFLFPIYGSGELPQAFCRFCAVYGGVYCLKRHISALNFSEEDDSNLTSFVCSNGQTISCSALVCAASDVMSTFNIKPGLRLARGILLVDGPIRNMKGQVVLLTLPVGSIGPDQKNDIRLLQLPPSTNTAVEGTYMCHLISSSPGDSSAEQDLSGVADLFFSTSTQEIPIADECRQPKILSSLYFNMELCHVDQDTCHLTMPHLPKNMYLTSDPDGTMTYEHAVQEAKNIFLKVCPGKDFLPPAESESESSTATDPE